MSPMLRKLSPERRKFDGRHEHETMASIVTLNTFTTIHHYSKRNESSKCKVMPPFWKGFGQDSREVMSRCHDWTNQSKDQVRKRTFLSVSINERLAKTVIIVYESNKGIYANIPQEYDWFCLACFRKLYCDYATMAFINLSNATLLLIYTVERLKLQVKDTFFLLLLLFVSTIMLFVMMVGRWSMILIVWRYLFRTYRREIVRIQLSLLSIFQLFKTTFWQDWCVSRLDDVCQRRVGITSPVQWVRSRWHAIDYASKHAIISMFCHSFTLFKL